MHRRGTVNAPPAPLLLSIEQATGTLGISRSKLCRLLRAGELETVTIGRRRLVRMSALERLVADLTASNEPVYTPNDAAHG